MRIQSKILMLVTIFLCVFLLFLLVYTFSQKHVKDMLIESDKIQKENFITSILYIQQDQFQRVKSEELSNPMVPSTILAGNKEWLEQNIRPLRKIDVIDCIWLYDAKGKLIYFAADENRQNMREIKFPTQKFDTLFQVSENYFHKYTTSGFMVYSGMIISENPVKKQDGKTKCYLVMGKLWDHEFFGDLSRRIGYTIELLPYDKNLDQARALVKNKSEDRISFNLPDDNGKTVAILDFSRANQLSSSFDELSLRTILYFFLIAGLMTIISLLLLKKWINNPLRWISHSLKANSPDILTKLDNDTTEFGEIAQLVDNFYSQKKLLETEMDERKLIEVTLRQSEEKNRALLKAIPDYMFIADEDGSIIDYNRQPDNVFNRKISEFLNQHLNDFIPVDSSNPIMKHNRLQNKYLNSTNHEFSLIVEDTVCYFEARFTKCSDTSVLIMIRDVSGLRVSERALRMSEELNRAIVEGSPLGITVRSATGKLLTYNRAWRKIWAIPDDAIENDLSKNRDEIHFDSRDEYLDKWQEAVKDIYSKGGTLYIPEAKTLGRRPGSAQWIAQYFYAITDSAGKVERVVILTEDISDRKRSHQELLTAKEQAEDANQAKTVFLANMSHEMRTPLNGILGMTQIIIKSDLALENREQMHIIQTSAQYLLQLITQVLDYSKLEAENLKMDMSNFSIRELLADIHKNFKTKALHKNIALEINVDPQVPGQITTDEKKIALVISNLIDNAIKFSSEKPVICTVHIEKGISNVNLLHVLVKDQGIGISQERHAQIFKSFMQTTADPTQYNNGTALGLAICKRIIEQMNGRIWLESDVGKGASFHFVIPVSVLDNHMLTPDFTQIPQGDEEVVVTDQLRIIVAEDNLINQKILSKMLERLGHHVGLAIDGKEAITLWETKTYDLILMDIQMPDMNGIEATIHIRDIEKNEGGHIPIVAVTAYAMVGDKEKFLVSGMDEYIPKPINVNQLHSILEKIIEWKKS